MEIYAVSKKNIVTSSFFTFFFFVCFAVVCADNVYHFNASLKFRGKKWTEVDFDYLYEEYVQFLMLNDDGFIYYLPSFLLYFYDLKHFALEYYLYFMDKLELGLNESKATYNAGRRRQDYSGFNKLSHEQSKLVAIFLVNTANLLPDGYMEKTQAQRALTNYWGNFLIF